jgi:NAD(P)-dependent dehydrogenase (short-subunit alcohol dehydrogenase family)
MKSVVVTGASTGIGWASAKLLLDKGFRVFGSVRKQADAERLKAEFGANFTPLIFDVTDEPKGEKLAGLVNNAGIAVTGPALSLSVDDFRRQMDVNVIGPIIVTQAFAPLLGADASLKGPPGRIVMISSVAGKNGNPMTSAYVASKHAIEGFSESLRRELMLFGIDVVIVAPGPVKTPIWGKGQETIDAARYQNSPYLPALQKISAFMQHLDAIALPPEKIAALVFDALTLPNPKVRYHIAPDTMRHLLAAVLPKRTMDRIIAKRLGLLPPAT